MKTFFAFIGIVAMTGCGVVSTPSPFADGHVTITGDAQGIRSFMDGMNGMITNGKASPDQDTAHWIARKHEEEQVTRRKFSPGLFQKLFSAEANK